MKRIAVTVVALLSVTSGAFANTILSETASPIAKITQGHGNPGESASSASDPDVSFRVLDNGKVGSDAQVNCRDAAVAVSLLLQFGCSAEDLAKSLSRTEQGDAESAIGALLDLLAAEPANTNQPAAAHG